MPHSRYFFRGKLCNLTGIKMFSNHDWIFYKKLFACVVHNARKVSKYEAFLVFIFAYLD